MNQEPRILKKITIPSEHHEILLELDDAVRKAPDLATPKYRLWKFLADLYPDTKNEGAVWTLVWEGIHCFLLQLDYGQSRIVVPQPVPVPHRRH